MVSDFGLSRDVYESGEYESTSGVGKKPLTFRFNCFFKILALCILAYYIVHVVFLFSDSFLPCLHTGYVASSLDGPGVLGRLYL